MPIPIPQLGANLLYQGCFFGCCCIISVSIHKVSSEHRKNPLTVIKKSNSRTGYKNSEETKQKMKDVWHQTHTPKPLSKETKDKISKSNKKKIIQISNNNDYIKIWDSAIDIERELGYWHTAIANVCNGRRKTAYGYIWKYA